MRKNRSKIVCIKLVHLPYFYLCLATLNFPFLMLIYALCKYTLQCRILTNYELKDCERRRSWPVWDTSPEYNWRDWGKPLNRSPSVVGIPAVIRTGYIEKTPTVRTIICSSPLIIAKTEVMVKVASYYAYEDTQWK